MADRRPLTARKRLTALIPAHNDDYTLDLCLAGIVEHFDEIVVLDDGSSDLTVAVAADAAARHQHVRVVRHDAGRGLGWIEARNRLMAETDSDWLFFLDADDVLAEYSAPMLRRIAEGSERAEAAPIVRLQLTELWGDFGHTTGRLRHYDRCHTFLNRARLQNGSWGGGTAAKLLETKGMRPTRSDGPLFFHIKGVKPDRRLVERAAMRRWLSAGRPGTLDAFAGLADMAPDEVHARALRTLLHSRQDRIRPLPLGAPELPAVLRAAPWRFRMVHDAAGRPVDRLDHGWHPSHGSPVP